MSITHALKMMSKPPSKPEDDLMIKEEDAKETSYIEVCQEKKDDYLVSR